jgi:hypothetical protein
MAEFPSSDPKFNLLSLPDLLYARDQFHLHLMNKAHVIGTAVGRYLIRKQDPYPTPKGTTQTASREQKKKEKRTLENSEVRDYSWPCVLVFVAEWIDPDKFSNREGEFSLMDFVPHAHGHCTAGIHTHRQAPENSLECCLSITHKSYADLSTGISLGSSEDCALSSRSTKPLARKATSSASALSE